MTVTLKNALRSIREQLPTLKIEALQQVESGQNSMVLFVNHALVFRFPRYERSRMVLRREATMLTVLHQHIRALIIPRLLHDYLHLPLGQAFLAHEKVSGEPVNIYELGNDYNNGTLRQLAGQLAAFLQELQAIPLVQVRGILPEHNKDYWRTMYDEIQAYLFPLMRSAAREDVRQNFEEFLAAENIYPATVVHGDFATGNILFDPEHQRFCSVIDFGSTCIGDPAVDLAALYGFKGRGSELARLVIEHHPAWEALLPRVRFYASTFALQEALFGIEHNDQAAFIAGMESYR